MCELLFYLYVLDACHTKRAEGMMMYIWHGQQPITSSLQKKKKGKDAIFSFFSLLILLIVEAPCVCACVYFFPRLTVKAEVLRFVNHLISTKHSLPWKGSTESHKTLFICVR